MRSRRNNTISFSSEILPKRDTVYEILTPFSPIGGSVGLQTTNTAYFTYLGRVRVSTQFNYVKCGVTVVASGGTPTNEVGLFSTTSEPTGGSMTLRKIASSASMDSLTAAVATSGNQSGSPLRAFVLRGTYLWAGIYINGYSTAPTLLSMARDSQSGCVLTTSTPTAFASGTTWTGSVPADAIDSSPVGIWLEARTFY